MKLTLTSGRVGRVTPCAPSDAGQTSARSGVTRPTRRKSAFTLVEIALSLAIIGFALVAIIGVLPTGLNVQRDNREETIIVHEANYFLDAIRNGAKGLDDLTNSVISITNYWTEYNASWQPGRTNVDGYTRFASSRTSTNPATGDCLLTTGYPIIGLLGQPKFVPGDTSNTVRSNHVVAYLHALSGAASEKFPVTNTIVLDLAFNYRMIVEVHPVPVNPVRLTGYSTAAETNAALARAFVREIEQANLHELRLIFRWPLQANGTTGNGRQVFRTMTGGQLVKTNAFGEPNQPLFFFAPTTFVPPNAP